MVSEFDFLVSDVCPTESILLNLGMRTLATTSLATKSARLVDPATKKDIL